MNEEKKFKGAPLISYDEKLRLIDYTKWLIKNEFINLDLDSKILEEGFYIDELNIVNTFLSRDVSEEIQAIVKEKVFDGINENNFEEYVFVLIRILNNLRQSVVGFDNKKGYFPKFIKVDSLFYNLLLLGFIKAEGYKIGKYEQIIQNLLDRFSKGMFLIKPILHDNKNITHLEFLDLNIVIPIILDYETECTFTLLDQNNNIYIDMERGISIIYYHKDHYSIKKHLIDKRDKNMKDEITLGQNFTDNTIGNNLQNNTVENCLKKKI